MSKSSELFERPNTKRRVIGDLCESGMSKIEVWNELRPRVTAQTEPFIFSHNTPHGRTPKSMQEQYKALKDEIGRVFALMGRAENASFDSEEIPPMDAPADAPTPDPVPSPDPISEQEEEQAEEEEQVPEPPKVAAKGKSGVREEIAYFLRRVREIRAFCKLREERSEPIDEIGIRPAEVAGKLIPAGIPADALLDAMTFHWEADTRNDAGITTFDFKRLSAQIAEEREIDMDGKHEMFPYVLTLVEERIPVFLVGPMGTGKSFLCRQIADYLNIPYGETACSAGATRGDFYGRLTASNEKPFILSKFAEVYGNGGVFNFEEIDAALPEILIALNNALAGDAFYNSSNGEDYNAHPDFVAMATGNTFGTGANRLYTARERLDAATLDRWRMGRVLVELDPRIEEMLAFRKLNA